MPAPIPFDPPVTITTLFRYRRAIIPSYVKEYEGIVGGSILEFWLAGDPLGNAVVQTKET